MSRRPQPAAGNAHPGLLFTALALVLLTVLAILRLGPGDAAFVPDALAAPAAPARGTATVVPSGQTSDRQGVVMAGAFPSAEPDAVTVAGRAVDVHGNGLPGIAIGRAPAAAGDEALATSGSDGAFVVRNVTVGTRLAASDERWETIAAATVRLSAPAIVVVAPRIVVAGTVLDAEGRPVAGAMLAIAIPAGVGDEVGVCGVQWLAFSDADGAFAFAAAPGLAAARLCTQHAGHRPDERALPIARPTGVVVTLVAEPSPPPVSGTVYGPDGAPFANVSVRIGEAVVATASDGTFALVPPPRLPRGTWLFALANGCIPVALPDPRSGDGREAVPIVVQLQPAVAITGRIVDVAGAPLPQWTVCLGDPTPLVPGRGFEANVEGWLGATRVVTDASGQFTIPGVFARPYTIEAWEERGERGLRAAVSPTDGPVTLVAHERDAAPLHGIVVDGDGRPVAGVLVGEQRPGCLASGALAMRFDHRVTTGVDGRFELPRRGAALHLVVDGAAIVPSCIALPAATAGNAPLRLEVARRRNVLVGDAGVEGLAFVPVDDDGRPLPGCEPSPGTFGLPTTARALAVHRHGTQAGVLPMPTNGGPIDLRLP